MRKLILFFLLFLVHTIQSQNYLTSLPFSLKKDGKAFSYVDKTKNETYLFLANSNEVKVSHYDNTFNFIDTFSTIIPGNKTDNIIGFTKNESSINIIWSSKSGDRFVMQNIDFKTKQTSHIVKNIRFLNETILQTFSTNDMFYCLTVINGTNFFRLYRFSNTNTVDSKTIEISGVLEDSKNESANIYSLFTEEFNGYEKPFELQNIDTSLPNSIALCSKKRKAYLVNNELIITFDNNTRFTQIIRINLTDFKSEVIKIVSSTTIESKKSNSFLFENNLYQIKVSALEMAFDIKKLDGSVIQSFSAKKEEEISFKNSNFNTEWINKYNEKEIENTSQFLKKISDYSVGISCYSFNGKNIVSIGGVSKEILKVSEDEKNNQAIMAGSLAGGGLLLATAYLLLYDGSNTTYSNFKSSRNIVSINSLFSKEVTLLPEKIKSFSGTKIGTYFNDYSTLKQPTFFSNNNRVFIGYNNEDANQYVIMEFKN